jgi:twitching motility protein PilT
MASESSPKPGTAAPVAARPAKAVAAAAPAPLAETVAAPAVPPPAEVKKWEVPGGLKVAEPVPGEPLVNQLFRTVMLHEGSDLHLKAGQPGMMRLRGVIQRMETPVITQDMMEKLFAPIMNDKARKQMEEKGGADFAHVIGDDLCRFRVNILRQRGKLAMVARRVNQKIPTFANLGLPPSIEKLCHYDQGLVILAGVTGSGKSTTIASMLDYMNEREALHILTIEDPIEFTFTDKMSVINQREVYLDVSDWHTALKHAVREDPDVILVGEMRDQETFEAGVHAAETGHVVFGTIHASTAASTVSRILDLFPPNMHHAIRQTLGFNLKAIVAQKLVPCIIPGKQRVPTNEILIVNPIVKELILKNKDDRLSDAIRANFNEGMLDFTESLRQLVEKKHIDIATALEFAPNPDQLKMAIKGIKVAAPGII